MINAIVVDDEWYNVEEIGDLIDNTGFMKVARKYQNPVKALEEFSELLPEVAFIDIEMPEIDGITLAEKFLEKKPDTIIAFITSWKQYAVQAFDLNAIDYIMKPIKLERFQKMAHKILCEIELKKSMRSNRLHIKCFGQFEVSIGGMPVKWERAKAEELFAYLLMNHHKYVHKDMIIEDLWSEYEPQSALRILQTSICKIRSLFSELREEVIIDYSGSKYCMVITNVDCDYLEVEKALSTYRRKDTSTYVLVEEAYMTFSKGFLNHQGYLWSYIKEEDLRRKLIKIINEIILHYSMENNMIEYIKFLKYLSLLSPNNEDVNYQLLVTLKMNGNEDDAYQHYQWLEAVLKEDYDSNLSEAIKNIFYKKGN